MRLVLFALLSLGASAAMASVHIGPACEPGTWGFVPVKAAHSRYNDALRQCLPNGRYFKDQADPVIRSCVEGSTATFTLQDVSGRSYDVTRTCVNSRFFPKSYAKILVCKEGSQAQFSYQDVSGRSYDVWETCQSGKWK